MCGEIWCELFVFVWLISGFSYKLVECYCLKKLVVEWCICCVVISVGMSVVVWHCCDESCWSRVCAKLLVVAN